MSEHNGVLQSGARTGDRDSAGDAKLVGRPCASDVNSLQYDRPEAIEQATVGQQGEGVLASSAATLNQD